jgi:hypothetical protein
MGSWGPETTSKKNGNANYERQLAAGPLGLKWGSALNLKPHRPGMGTQAQPQPRAGPGSWPRPDARASFWASFLGQLLALNSGSACIGFLVFF